MESDSQASLDSELLDACRTWVAKNVLDLLAIVESEQRAMSISEREVIRGDLGTFAQRIADAMNGSPKLWDEFAGGVDVLTDTTCALQREREDTLQRAADLFADFATVAETLGEFPHLGELTFVVDDARCFASLADAEWCNSVRILAKQFGYFIRDEREPAASQSHKTLRTLYHRLQKQGILTDAPDVETLTLEEIRESIYDLSQNDCEADEVSEELITSRRLAEELGMDEPATLTTWINKGHLSFEVAGGRGKPYRLLRSKALAEIRQGINEGRIQRSHFTDVMLREVIRFGV